MALQKILQDSSSGLKITEFSTWDPSIYATGTTVTGEANLVSAPALSLDIRSEASSFAADTASVFEA